jgi:hypothetical protein
MYVDKSISYWFSRKTYKHFPHLYPLY